MRSSNLALGNLWILDYIGFTDDIAVL